MPEIEQQFGITSPVEESTKESIKLYKNTKGYNWDIKLVGDIDAKQMERLKLLNDWCINTFGSMI